MNYTIGKGQHTDYTYKMVLYFLGIGKFYIYIPREIEHWSPFGKPSILLLGYIQRFGYKMFLKKIISNRVKE